MNRVRRAAVAAAAAGALVVAGVADAPLADAAGTRGLQAAAAYAHARGYKTGIAIADTRTGRVYVGGRGRSAFASESVVKVLIATEILLRGRMHGSTERIAYKMITQSDDASADRLYGLSGGDQTIGKVERHYHLNIGYPPHRAGWWGNTHIYPVGLARFYVRVRHDRRVWPWLFHAMRHAHRFGSDGTYQFFGIPSVVTTARGVKQGWGLDDNCFCHAVYNTTGYIDGGRYAVVIMTKGPASTYGSQIAHMVTAITRRVLPGGHLHIS